VSFERKKDCGISYLIEWYQNFIFWNFGDYKITVATRKGCYTFCWEIFTCTILHCFSYIL